MAKKKMAKKKSSRLPATVKKGGKGVALTTQQARYQEAVTKFMDMGNEGATAFLERYWKMGHVARAVEIAEGAMHNADNQPATLKDFAKDTEYAYDMVSKIARFSGRFPKEIYEKMRDAKFESATGKPMVFNWSHIDALMRMGAERMEDVKKLIDTVIEKGWPATRLYEEVKKLKEKNDRPGSGRPPVPTSTFTRIAGRSSNLLDDFEKLDKCLETYFDDDDRPNDSELVAMLEKLDEVKDEADRVVQECRTLLKG